MFDATKDESRVISQQFHSDEDGDYDDANEYDVDVDVDDEDDDNEWNALLSKEKIYTEVPPPGPKAFVDWYTSTNHGSTTSHAENDVEFQINSAQCCAVRDFMGPYDDGLHNKVLEHKNQALLRRRRNTQHNNKNTKTTTTSTTDNNETTSSSNNNNNSKTSAHSYECASYKKLDTPICK